MKIAFDINEMKPGCVLLQATFDCDPHIAHKFKTEHWLLAPTPEMKVYELTPQQLEILVDKVEAHHG